MAAVVVGRVVGAHGVRGDVRVRWLGDGPDNLLSAERVALADPERGRSDPAPRTFDVRGGGPGRQGEVRLSFVGIEDRDGAEALRGRLVLVDASVLPTLPDGEFYWHELVGCRVETEAGADLGRVRELWETGAHDLLVVIDAEGRRRLVPTAGPAILAIEPAAGRIVVDDTPGLFEPEAN